MDLGIWIVRWRSSRLDEDQGAFNCIWNVGRSGRTWNGFAGQRQTADAVLVLPWIVWHSTEHCMYVPCDGGRIAVRLIVRWGKGADGFLSLVNHRSYWRCLFMCGLRNKRWGFCLLHPLYRKTPNDMPAEHALCSLHISTATLRLCKIDGKNAEIFMLSSKGLQSTKIGIDLPQIRAPILPKKVTNNGSWPWKGRGVSLIPWHWLYSALYKLHDRVTMTVLIASFLLSSGYANVFSTNHGNNIVAAAAEWWILLIIEYQSPEIKNWVYSSPILSPWHNLSTSWQFIRQASIFLAWSL